MPYVLVVEDDMDQRAMMLLALQEKGLKCVGAENGLEALNYIFDPLRKTNPYLILLDLSMPIMDGQKFLNVIQHCKIISSIPIVIISGSDRTPPNGITFLRKPIKLDLLYEVSEKAYKNYLINKK